MALPIRVARVAADPFDHLPRELGTLMDRFFNARESATSTFTPYGVDVREDADHFYVEAELPGFTKDQVDITMENATLTITAERKSETPDGPQGDWLLRERKYTRFARSFTLPPTVNESTVDAKLVDGVLKITLNKREETKPRKINVA
ncbi:MAG TPA: Hsp20/alpha crystallin family protein [Tepidisphaeraceae bacterium]|jgi:HSP20 family protein